MKKMLMTTATILALSGGTATAWEFDVQSVFFNGGGSLQLYGADAEISLGGDSFAQAGVTAVSYGLADFGDIMLEAHYGRRMSPDLSVGAFATYENWSGGSNWYAVGGEAKYSSGDLKIEGYAANSIRVGGGASDPYWGISAIYQIHPKLAADASLNSTEFGNRFSLGAVYNLTEALKVRASYETFSGGGNGISVSLTGVIGEEVTFAPKNWAKVNF